jgi:glycosyltransferase involved in cell wall biosynthesis
LIGNNRGRINGWISGNAIYGKCTRIESMSTLQTPRVLLISGPAVGGMRRHVESLAVGLPEKGFEVAVAAPAAMQLGPLTARFGIELGDRPRPASDLSALWGLRQAVRGWRPDLVHAHGVKAALLALGSRLPGRPPVVVTFHNLWHGGPLTLPLRLVTQRAAAAVAVSEAVRERLAAHGIRPRELTVIPNGLDLTAFSAPRAPCFPPPPDRPFTFAFVGRLTEEKGVRVLLEAARRLPDAPEVRLVVAGDGPLRAAVEAEARRDGSRLEYRGHQHDVRAIYEAADAVLMPSLAEGHPLTALEAMASGLPLVASRAGGLAEIVVEGETGLLVPPGDASALADAVGALAADRDRARALGAAGRRRVELEFGVERMLVRLVGVYRGVLEGARTKSQA